MGSMRGFRCGRCRGEVLATTRWSGPLERSEWAPPLLCCGHVLQPLDVGQILLAGPLPRRSARCPRCGYTVRVVVHPVSELTCVSCQVALECSDAETAQPVGAASRQR